jgi:hypothetical protein
VTVARDGKVVNLGVGAEVATADRIRVALNSYVVAGGGGRFPRLREILRRPETQLRDTGTNSRDAVREFLKTRDPIHLEPRAWVVRQAR